MGVLAGVVGMPDSPHGAAPMHGPRWTWLEPVSTCPRAAGRGGIEAGFACGFGAQQHESPRQWVPHPQRCSVVSLAVSRDPESAAETELA